MPGHKGKGPSSRNIARDHRKYKPTFSNAHASTRNEKAEDKSAIKELDEKTEKSQNNLIKSKKQRGNKRNACTKVVSEKAEEERTDYKKKHTNAEVADSKVIIEKTSKKGAHNKKKASVKAACLNAKAACLNAKASNDSENNAKIDAKTNVNKKKDEKVNINDIKKAHCKSLRKMSGNVNTTADGAEVKNNDTNDVTAKKISKRLEDKQQKASTKAANVNANADNNLDNTTETIATVEIKLRITKKKQTPGKKQRKFAANKKNNRYSKAAAAKSKHNMKSNKHDDTQPDTSSQVVSPDCLENKAQTESAAVLNKAKNAHAVNEKVDTANNQEAAKNTKPDKTRKEHESRPNMRPVRSNRIEFVNSVLREVVGCDRDYLIMDNACKCEKTSSPMMLVGLEHGDVYYSQHKFAPNMRLKTGIPCKHRKLLRLRKKGPNPRPNNYI